MLDPQPVRTRGGRGSTASPTANTPSIAVSSAGPTSTAPVASITAEGRIGSAGTVPTPTIARSHSTILPVEVTTRSTRSAPSTRSTVSPKCIATPWSRWIASTIRPIGDPSTRYIAVSKHLHDRDIHPEGAERGADLRADEPHADDRSPAAHARPRPGSRRHRRCARRVHARRGRPPGIRSVRCAPRSPRPPGRTRCAPRRRGPPCRSRSTRSTRLPRRISTPWSSHHPGVADQPVLEGLLPPQELLRQRRPLVRRRGPRPRSAPAARRSPRSRRTAAAVPPATLAPTTTTVPDISGLDLELSALVTDGERGLGSSAGPSTTAPVVMSKTLPWHSHSISCR